MGLFVGGGSPGDFGERKVRRDGREGAVLRGRDIPRISVQYWAHMGENGYGIFSEPLGDFAEAFSEERAALFEGSSEGMAVCGV